MTLDPSNYQRENSADGSYSLFRFERADVISIFENLVECSFVFFKRLTMTSLHRPGFEKFDWLPVSL